MNFPAPEFYSDIALPEISTTASGREWRLRDADERTILALVQKFDLDPILARALAARGVSVDTAPDYLNPSLRQSLPDPFVLKDMELAAKRLAAAVVNGEGIGVFGDYDVDGTSASAILRLYFDAIGVELPVYLPDRIAEGYGPSIEAFRVLREKGAKIIVTVDCGAAARDVIELAVEEGDEVIVFDHHLMTESAPQGACAVVNPNRPDDISGLNNLSAAGVAFMGVVALNRELRTRGYFAAEERSEPDLIRFLDLAALGLVCDVMEMKGLTRVLVAQGLKVMDSAGNFGLKALARRAGAKGQPSTYHLGFLIGPRINAAGRIGHARLAFDLMTTPDEKLRDSLAERLHVMNAERQAIEANVQEAALKAITLEGLDKDEIIVVEGEGWHPGVIGIVAGRLKDKFDRPVIVIGIEGGIGKGSGRSIGGVDLGAAIGALNQEGALMSGGGHAMAAGLTVEASAVSLVRGLLNERLGGQIAEARKNRFQDIDALIGPSAVTADFARLIESAGPFGPGNPEPIFALADLRVAAARIVGENHLSVTLKGADGAEVRGIAFRAEGEPLGAVLRSNGRIHAVGKVRVDDWRGGGAGQLQISDAAPAL